MDFADAKSLVEAGGLRCREIGKVVRDSDLVYWGLTCGKIGEVMGSLLVKLIGCS